MEHPDPRSAEKERRTKFRQDSQAQGGDDAGGSSPAKAPGSRTKKAARKHASVRGGRAGARERAQGIHIGDAPGGGGDAAAAAAAEAAAAAGRYVRGERTQAQRDEELFGKKIDPRTCPQTPPRIDLDFGADQVIYQERQFLHEPLVNPGFDARLGKNYKNKASEVAKERKVDPFIFQKDESLDHRFWNQFHLDFYRSVILHSKHKAIVPMQYVDWKFMEDAQDPIFDKIIDKCTEFGMKELMGFKYDWNEEILAQFHASFYLKPSKDEIHWTTLGIHYCVDYKTFSRLLALGSKDEEKGSIHVEKKIKNHLLAPLYARGELPDGNSKGLKPLYWYLNHLFRHTIYPKKGDMTNLYGMSRNVLMRMLTGGRQFSVGLFIWEELIDAMKDARKNLPYAPYIMYVIEKVTKITFPKDFAHEPYRPKKPKSRWWFDFLCHPT